MTKSGGRARLAGKSGAKAHAVQTLRVGDASPGARPHWPLGTAREDARPTGPPEGGTPNQRDAGLDDGAWKMGGVHGLGGEVAQGGAGGAVINGAALRLFLSGAANGGQ